RVTPARCMRRSSSAALLNASIKSPMLRAWVVRYLLLQSRQNIFVLLSMWAPGHGMQQSLDAIPLTLRNQRIYVVLRDRLDRGINPPVRSRPGIQPLEQGLERRRQQLADQFQLAQVRRQPNQIGLTLGRFSPGLSWRSLSN